MSYQPVNSHVIPHPPCYSVILAPTRLRSTAPTALRRSVSVAARADTQGKARKSARRAKQGGWRLRTAVQRVRRATKGEHVSLAWRGARNAGTNILLTLLSDIAQVREPELKPLPYLQHQSSTSACKEQYFWDGSDCLACPDPGATCDEGSELERLVLDYGYYRRTFKSTSVYACGVADACVGGSGENGSKPNYW